MIKLNFPLNISMFATRPIFKAKINGKWISCMLDTGADMPVFCKGDILLKEWTEAIYFKDSMIGGFGKEAENTSLYNILNFQLMDAEGNYITFNNMKIAVMEKPKMPCDLILSASLLIKMRYIIDCLCEHPYLSIESGRSVYGVGFLQRKETIYIFAK